jgi:hypothetical protein
MRVTRIEVLQSRESVSLGVRGRSEKTFLSLGLFSGITLMVCGVYLLAKAILNPLEASEMTVLGAGFTLSLASFAMTYMLWPRGRWAADTEEESSQARRDGPVLTVYADAVQNRTEAKRALAEHKHLPGPM